MLDHAASKPSIERVEFRQADALKLPSADGQFDAVVVCQFGVMFFPDRVAAYREARRVLKPDGQSSSAFTYSDQKSVVSDRHQRHGDPLSARPAAISRACATWLSRCRRDTRRACDRRLHDSRNRDGRDDRSCGVHIATRPSASRQGSPMRAEIEARDPDGLQAATDAVGRRIEPTLRDRCRRSTDAGVGHHCVSLIVGRSPYPTLDFSARGETSRQLWVWKKANGYRCQRNPPYRLHRAVRVPVR